MPVNLLTSPPERTDREEPDCLTLPTPSFERSQFLRAKRRDTFLNSSMITTRTFPDPLLSISGPWIPKRGHVRDTQRNPHGSKRKTYQSLSSARIPHSNHAWAGELDLLPRRSRTASVTTNVCSPVISIASPYPCRCILALSSSRDRGYRYVILI
jgi:hypothetical protein